MASHFAHEIDVVADATRIMNEQTAEILRLRMQLVTARGLLRQANIYVGFIIKRWEQLGMNGEPASSVKADIEKFLEQEVQS